MPSRRSLAVEGVLRGVDRELRGFDLLPGLLVAGIGLRLRELERVPSLSDGVAIRIKDRSRRAVVLVVGQLVLSAVDRVARLVDLDPVLVECLVAGLLGTGELLACLVEGDLRGLAIRVADTAGVGVEFRLCGVDLGLGEVDLLLGIRCVGRCQDFAGRHGVPDGDGHLLDEPVGLAGGAR